MIDYSNLLYRQSLQFDGLIFHWKTILYPLKDIIIIWSLEFIPAIMSKTTEQEHITCTKNILDTYIKDKTPFDQYKTTLRLLRGDNVGHRRSQEYFQNNVVI